MIMERVHGIMKNNGLGFAIKGQPWTKSMEQHNSQLPESHSEAMLLLDSDLNKPEEPGATFGRGIIKKLNFDTSGGGAPAAATSNPGHLEDISIKGNKKAVRFEPPDDEDKLSRFMEKAESLKGLGQL